ncbi:phosphatidylglycerol lysyltransferase domain-containing protein [Mesorhizobium sp. KR1-2]|uniref:phosphatidylglycerol lysyltransferase domain-containing protein n=1 Tax=Mesorhizobium sp. KR1-2 TaxID=3156609 RepID=UPI0032B4AF1F
MRFLRKSFDAYLDRRAPVVPRAELALEDRLGVVRRHGDFSLAYSTAIQDDLSYFGDTDGYIAFATKMGSHFALGDPVAAPAERAALIRGFVAAARDPWFVQIGAATAATLADLGFRINRMGIDTRLPLPAHDFSGTRNETVRYSERWLLKRGFSIIEEEGDGGSLGHIERLSADWLAERVVKRWEMRFLNRPFRARLGHGMRRFVLADPDGRTVALLDFDPIHSGGEVVGYTTAFKRKFAGTTPHAEIGLTKFAVDRFRKEGHSIVTLGLSPLADIRESGFDESRFWRSMFSRAYDSGRINRHVFNLQGQAAFKRRFHGEEEPTYIAFKRGTPLEVMALLRLCKAV